MTVLGIESTAKAASAALVKDGNLLCEFYTNVGLQHSKTLLPMIESMLKCSGISLDTIDRIAVANGPGSFTGVRIGVSAAKGLAFPKSLPCVGVSTLEALAHNTLPCEHLICPVMDARCQQVYNALFQWDNGKLVRLTPDRAISIADLLSEIKNNKKSILWVGDGAEMCYNVSLEESLESQLIPEALRFQHAAQVAFLGEQAQKTVLPAQLEVSYLRPPQAVRARTAQTQEKDGSL